MYIKNYFDFLSEASISIVDNEIKEISESLYKNKNLIEKSLTDNDKFLNCLTEIFEDFKLINISFKPYRSQFTTELEGKIMEMFTKTMKLLNGDKNLLGMYKKYNFGLIGAVMKPSFLGWSIVVEVLFKSDAYKLLNKNFDKFDMFVRILTKIIQHELIHYSDHKKGELDFTKTDYDLNRVKLGKDRDIYLGDLKEIHAHANDTIQQFIDFKFSKDKIVEIIKKQESIKGCTVWNEYIKLIKPNTEKWSYYLEKVNEYLYHCFK